MDVSLMMVLAILATWVSINSGLFVLYLVYIGKSGKNNSRGNIKLAKTKKEKEVKDDSPVLVNGDNEAWGLQVKFKEPTIAGNERLAAILGSVGAVYDSTDKCFTVAGDSPRNPILIVNGYPPNTLPSFVQDNGKFPVKGVNVKLLKKKQSSTPNKMQLSRLVDVAKKLERIGGEVVDAENKKMTKNGYQAVINGKAVV